MSRESPLDVGLIISFSKYPKEPDSSLLQIALKELESSNVGNISVNWNLPLYPIFEDTLYRLSAFSETLQRRIKDGEDEIIPQGYTDAFHPLLLNNELKKEVEWGIKNPWRSGIKDLFNQRPQVFMPSLPDFDRKSTRDVYKGTGCNFLFILSDSDSEIPSRCYVIQEEVYAQLPVFMIEDILPKGYSNPRSFSKKRLLRSTLRKIYHLMKKKSGPVLIYSKIDGKEIIDQLMYILDVLCYEPKHVRSVRFHTISSLLKKLDPSESSGSSVARPRFVFSLTPEENMMLAVVAGIREPSHQSNDVTKKVLQLLSSVQRDVSQGYLSDNNGSTEPVNRKILANMQGFAVLTDLDFDVCFSEGRFFSIRVHDRNIAGVEKAICSLSIESTTYAYETQSAFSFEGEQTRGLREYSILNGAFAAEPGTLLVDYLFVDEFPYLIIDVILQYPAFNGSFELDFFKSYEITLFKFEEGEEIVLTALSADGEEHKINITAEERTDTVFGSAFLFSHKKDSLLLSLAQKNMKTMFPLPFQIRQEKKEYTFSINPHGHYGPLSSDVLSGWREHFFLLMKPQEQKIYPIHVPGFVSKEIPDSGLRPGEQDQPTDTISPDE